MRIISGTARGRRLQPPARTKGRPVIRPTSDRAREALFNIIGREVVGATVLDLYAGTGALGIESLSRGARAALFVDRDQEALSLIASNIEMCGFSEKSRIMRRDLRKGLSFLQDLGGSERFSLIFVDPPYGTGAGGRAVEALAALPHRIAPGGLIVVEDAVGEELPEMAAGLALVDRRRYGDTGFWLYRPEKFPEVGADQDQSKAG